MKKVNFVASSSVELNKEIINIGKAGAKLNTRIQSAALNCIHYVNEHGDTGYANRLMVAMGNGLRKASLQNFLCKFGKLEYSKELKSLVFNKGKKDVLAIDAIDEMWYDSKASKVVAESVDIEQLVVAFIKNAEKKITDTPLVMNGGLLDLVKLALDQFREEQITEEAEQEQTAEIAALMGAINQRKAA